MYNLARLAIFIFWLLDVFNLPFMEQFDTTYPLNFWFWFVLWILLPGASTVQYVIKERKNREHDLTT